jgi:cyanophycinase-like exopeptidase
MGSGETSPTMIKTHRSLFERLGNDPSAVLLDTPFGFQENADDIASKAVEYFASSVGRSFELASFRSAAVDALQRESAFERVRAADFVFSGPGSPSYALRQWRDTPIPALLGDKLRDNGCVCFASAAALTLGLVTVPVYEIYKVGAEPEWLDGLDLLSATGLRAAVIPHFDNAVGGNHDTRYCYLGERRLRMLEASLPDGAFVLGVDEHTACVFDLDAGTASVTGLGGVTVRHDGAQRVIPTGTTVGIDELATGGDAIAAPAPAASEAAAATPAGSPLL